LLSRTHLLHLFSNECGGFEHSISVKYDLRFGIVLQRNRAANPSDPDTSRESSHFRDHPQVLFTLGSNDAGSGLKPSGLVAH
jgi:hypothetical protein